MLGCQPCQFYFAAMSFSRLSPRSARTGVTRGRASIRTPEKSSHHLRLWEAIRITREEIDLRQRQVEQVDTLFHQFIVPREAQLTNEYCNVTKHLIGHFEHAELSTADQSLLGLWISENLQSLNDHPFASIQRRQILNDAWRTLINLDGAIENQLARLARSKNSASPSYDQKIRQSGAATSTGNKYNAQQPDAGRHQSSSQETDAHGYAGSSSDNVSSDHLDTRAHKASRYSENNTDDINEKINILEQRLSAERLFRQLAKVLHPDREQNETLKAEKHILMSQCLKARQEKDINTLLSLYCEHVGDLPDDLSDNSHEELILALQQQLKQLQMELRQLRFGDPLHSQIVERYASLENADCERRINRHADSLDIEIENTKLLASQLDTQFGLMDALEQRREVEMDRLAIDELTGMSY